MYSNWLFRKHLGLALSTSAALLAFAGSALAQEECGDTTCEAGFECVTGQSACPAIACAEGEECEIASCETEEYSYCERAACSSDADCGEYMVCGTFTNGCATVDVAECPPDTECEPVKPEPCEETQFSQCTPKWELPCEVAADCGEGFDCKPIESCSCSGSAGSEGGGSAGAPAPAVDGGTADGTEPAADPATSELVAPDRLPADCTCEPTDESYCAVQETECATAADCPADWTCEAYAQDCPVSSDGSSTCGEAKSVCQPPYALVYASGGDILTSNEAAQSGVATGSGNTADPGAPVPDRGEEGVDMGAVAPNAPGTNNGEAVAGEGDASSMMSSSANGCTVGSPLAPAGNGLLWSALGLGLLALRRPARRRA